MRASSTCAARSTSRTASPCSRARRSATAARSASSSRASTAASRTGCSQVALDALVDAGVSQDAITVMPVPGAFELPLAAMALAKTRRYACIVALGAVVRGETPHFDYVAAGVRLGAAARRDRDRRARSRSASSRSTRSSRRRPGSQGGRRRPLGARDGRPVRPAPGERQRSSRYNPARNVEGLRNLWQEAGVRQPSLALDGRHEAALRPEPAARSRAPQGLADSAPTSAPVASRATKCKGRLATLATCAI